MFYGIPGVPLSAGTRQNRIETQENAPRPTMPGYAIGDDAPFAAMVTPEDQIHWLYKHLLKYLTDVSGLQQQIDDLAAKFPELKAYVDAQDADLRALILAKYEELLKLIHDGSFSVVVKDPTHGQSPREVETVVARVYAFDRYFGITAQDFDSLGTTAAAFDALQTCAYDFDTAYALIRYV